MSRPPRPLGRRGAGPACAATLLLLIACGEPESAAPQAAAPARKLAHAAPARDAGAPRLRVARASDGSLRVEARQVPRFQVLQELARTAGFSVRAGSGRPPPRTLDLDLEGVSAEQALARILGDVPHHLDYEPDAAAGESVLRRVTVGLLPTAAAGEHPAKRARFKSPRSEERSEAQEPAPRSDEERRAEIEAKRGSRDAAERARAAALMRPEEQLADLAATLASDPDPGVRASAAGALGEVEGGEIAFQAADALLAATLDPDPEVAAAAIVGLESVHDVLPDPRFRARVAALAGHRDPRVRAAVASFLEWTDDDTW